MIIFILFLFSYLNLLQLIFLLICLTRLDRLLTLLSNGDSLAVKRSAATQIGQVVSTYPKEVEPILNKVNKSQRILFFIEIILLLFKLKRHVIHSSWDVRIACGFTIELISKNISNEFSGMKFRFD
jgi:hypothetical protein